MHYSNTDNIASERVVNPTVEGVSLRHRHPVRVTALSYIREAFLQGALGELPELVGIAYEFGAETREVRDALMGFGFGRKV